jgi:hypothetical protein
MLFVTLLTSTFAIPIIFTTLYTPMHEMLDGMEIHSILVLCLAAMLFILLCKLTSANDVPKELPLISEKATAVRFSIRTRLSFYFRCSSLYSEVWNKVSWLLKSKYHADAEDSFNDFSSLLVFTTRSACSCPDTWHPQRHLSPAQFHQVAVITAAQHSGHVGGL